MPSHIPIDVVDIILDQFCDDTHTLMNASRVARAWLPSCRSRLFNCISIVDDSAGFECIRWFEARQDLARHVRQICVRFQDCIDGEVIGQVLKCFERLRAIDIEGGVSKVKSGMIPFPLYCVDFLGIHIPQGLGQDDPDEELGNCEGLINVLLMFSLWHVEELLVTLPRDFTTRTQHVDEFLKLQSQPSTMRVNALVIILDTRDGLVSRIFRHLLHAPTIHWITARGWLLLLGPAFRHLLVVSSNLTNLRMNCGAYTPILTSELP